jgi:rRNA processing protein Gar1
LRKNTPNYLQEAGTVLHLARSGRLIIQASSQIPDGKLLVDEDGRRTGRVIETIGPVASPYLSVQPMTDRIERLIGSKLFVSETVEREDIAGKPFSRRGGPKGPAHGQNRSKERSERKRRKRAKQLGH